MWGAFIAGIVFAGIIIGIFQIGINVGLKTCINMLDGNYPAAMNYLNKNKRIAHILPYVMEAKTNE